MEGYSVVSMRKGKIYYTNNLSKVEAIRTKRETMLAFNLLPSDVWIEREN